MFWYKRKTIDSLITLGRSLTLTEKNTLQNHCVSFLGEYKLAFNREDRVYIEDNELSYIEGLIRVSSDDNMIKVINDALSVSQLSYKDGVIINSQGACATIQEEHVGGDILIRKRTKERDISREFDLISMLNKYSNNEHVIRVKENSFDGTSYLMETASESLETYMDNNKNLETRKRFEIVQRLLDCVSFVHSQGVLHRDLHPGNMLLIYQGSRAVWKLSDFGFSCKINEIATNSEELDKRSYGRPDFTAPEQLRSLSNASIQSDIYSVGKLINFVITNSCNKNSHPLHDITERCCRKDPLKRYTSVAEIKAEISLMRMPQD